MSIPTSAFNGLLVYSDDFVVNATENTATTHQRFSLINENPTSMAQQMIAANRGCLRFIVTAANSVGAYGDYCCLHLTRIPQLPNMEILVRWVIPSTTIEQYFFVNVRCDLVSDSGAVPTNGYAFQHVSPVAGGDANIRKNVAGTDTFLVGDDRTLTSGDCWLRGFVRGSTIGVRTWQSTDPEPRHWVTVEDTDLPGRGYVTVGLSGGNSGTDNFTMDMMELHVWDLDRPASPVTVL